MENKTFFEDFKKFQQECPVIPLDSKAQIGKYSFKYASLGSILKIVRPILHENNMIIYWECREKGGVTCVLEHKPLPTSDKEALVGMMLRPSYPDTKTSTVMIKSSDDPKQQGAAITYAKRYSLVALLGIVAEEDKDAPDNQTNAKPKISDKAFNQVKDKITNGKKDITKQCLLHFDLSQQQHDELLNLELEYNG